MKRFAALFAALDSTTKTSAKLTALTQYFETAPEPDRVWTIAILSGRRPKRSVNATELRLWAAEAAGIPDWLFEESYTIVGDLADGSTSSTALKWSVSTLSLTSTFPRASSVPSSSVIN